jgi:pyridoxamine 5'-phosphate oxidase
MKLDDMREEYTRGELHRRDLNPDPVAQFTVWFDQACHAGIIEPNAMSLATVGADGRPTLRTVLLKQYDQRGFVFFTNLEGRKAQQIEGNPQVALLFPWIGLERQVVINGQAEKISAAETMAYFITRPLGSQLSAWASPQSRVVESRKFLEMKWHEIKRKFAAGQVPLPSFWGGFRVRPEQIEFWQGRKSRLHDRFLYSRAPDGGWKIDRLAP